MEAGFEKYINDFKGKEVVVLFVEEGISKDYSGTFIGWDMNYIYIDGKYSRKIINTANITSIKQVKKNGNT